MHNVSLGSDYEMKKQMIILVVCVSVFFVCMPTTTAVFPQSVNNLKTRVSTVDETTLITDSPPDWATGNFSGTWGISILGIPTIELGWIEGYFQVGIVGRVEGVFAEYDKSETAQIGALVIGYFFLGVVGNETTGNWTYCVGLGGFDETSSEFYFNLHLFLGPGFYMRGTFSEFN